MCDTIIGTPTCNSLYNLSLSVKQHQVFSLLSFKVGEYTAGSRGTFLYTESLQIIQGLRSSLVLFSSAQPTGFKFGLDQGTEMTMAEDCFCVQLAMFVCIFT